jgi:mono/diheme cytochrome c family protein
MRKLKLNSLVIQLTALAFTVAGAACSDDSTTPTVDAGKKDSSVDVATHDVLGQDTVNTPDLPATQSDLAGIDSPTADARVVDTGNADTPVADAPGKDVPITDSAVERVADIPAIDGAVDGTAVDGGNPLVARGRYLVDHVIACSDCHTPKTATGTPDMTRYLAGNANFVKLPDGSALPSANLTPDPTGLGNYTDAQIKHMFMDGLTPQAVDGGTRALNPVMPYYVFHNMNSQDADAIVAYLRSIPPVNNPLPPPSPAFVVDAPANYLDPSTIPTPATTYPQRDSALRGRYLAAESGLCIECHTPHPASGPNAIDPTMYFQGGEDFSNFFAGTLNIHPVSANLTSDPTTGLGDWTTEQIVTVLLKGVDDQGTGICPPMPAGPNGAYGGLTPDDARDIANYIKSLPPAVHDVPDMCTWPPAPAVDGGQPVDALMSVDADQG